MNSTTRNEHQFFCPKCRRLLPLSQFYVYSNGRRSGYCKRGTCKMASDRMREKREDKAFRAEENAKQRARFKKRYHTDAAFREYELKRHRKPLPQLCTNCEKYPCFEGIDNMSSNLALTCHSYTQR